MRKNEHLVNLDLGHNLLGVEGARRFAECLKDNATLQYVNLEWNNIGTPGLTAIVKALKANQNSALEVLDVHSNKIDAQGAIVCSFFASILHWTIPLGIRIVLGDQSKTHQCKHPIQSNW